MSVVVVAKTMDKVYRIANPQQPNASAAVAEKDTDWDKCVLCQEITGEVLKYPAGSKCSMDGAGRKTLADNLLAFKKMDCLPSSIFFRLKKGQDIEETFRSHKARWHDSSIIKPNFNELRNKSHPQQKVLMFPRSTLIRAQSKILMRQNNASSVGNLQKLQSHCTMLQHLVLMPMSESVPYNYIY